LSGNAHGAGKNTNCMLGEIYRFPNNTRPANLVNWNTPPGAACQPVPSYNNQGQRIFVQINPVLPPPPPNPAVAVTPLPKNPWDPANLPKCPFTCQAYNPASGTCVGAAMNAC
jgi:hypothetical protein